MVEKRKIKPRPKKQVEIIDSYIEPYDKIPNGKPTINEFNRSTKTSVKNDEVKDLSIGLQDLDEAILYYFDNVLKPSVFQNGNKINVPVIYGSPERWKAVQADGFYRDKDSRIMAPLIMFKRDTIEKNRTVGNKLDANHVRNFQVFEKKYSNRNYYDNFSALNNRIPVKELYGVIIPDYITINYSCIIFTNFVEHMNGLIESINFASDSYWGDKERFQFRTKIDSFSPQVTLESGNDRVIKTNFNIVLQGYIIPDTINKDIASNGLNKFYSKSRLIFDMETVSSINKTTTNKPIKVPSIFIDGGITNNNNGEKVPTEVLTYLSWVKVKTADPTSQTGDSSTSTAIFRNSTIYIAPGDLPPTSKEHFTIYVNGVYLEHPAIISLTQNGTDVILVVDNAAANFIQPLDANDEIIAVGKFE